MREWQPEVNQDSWQSYWTGIVNRKAASLCSAWSVCQMAIVTAPPLNQSIRMTPRAEVTLPARSKSGIGSEQSNDNRQGDETVATGYRPAVCKIAPIWRTATNPNMTGDFFTR